MMPAVHKPSPSPATVWLRRARILCIAVNAAWFWQKLLPALVVLNLLLAASVLILRQGGGAALPVLPLYGLALGGCVVFAIVRLRGKCYTQQDALLRMETALHLHNRLTCAAAGVTSWPPPSACRGKVLHPRPLPALLPLLYSLAFIAAALWLPVRSENSNSLAGAMVEPSAWAQVADWAELLHEEKIVAEPSVDTLEERLSQLRERPQEEWYRQGSLEAGETLRDETLLAMQELARQLQATRTLLENIPLQEAARATSGIGAEQLDAQWRKQLEQLQNGQLTIDPEVLAQMQALSFSQMNNLTPDQHQAMLERLQKGAQAVGGAAGLSELELESVSLQMQQAFSGEPSRDPAAPVPLVMVNEGTDLQSGRRDGISNQDLRNAVLGESVGTSSRPGNDAEELPFASGIQTDGSATGGEGGKAVWQEHYTPQERAILEHYFQ